MLHNYPAFVHIVENVAQQLGKQVVVIIIIMTITVFPLKGVALHP